MAASSPPANSRPLSLSWHRARNVPPYLNEEATLIFAGSRTIVEDSGFAACGLAILPAKPQAAKQSGQHGLDRLGVLGGQGDRSGTDPIVLARVDADSREDGGRHVASTDLAL